MAVIVIDAGHGGFDNGAMYQGRKEKDDNLRLALAVGNLLEQKGYDVIYTRTEDVYQSPYEKAQIANEAGADYFISFHRNSAEKDNTYHGVQTLVFGGDAQAEHLAETINRKLEQRGFENIGIEERPGLVVLRRTKMPAVLIETGFINHDGDNKIFDEDFYGVAQAIASAIEDVVPLEKSAEPYDRQENQTMSNQKTERENELFFGVEAGRFRYAETANFMAERLTEQGFQSYVYEENNVYHIIAGKEKDVESAQNLQRKLRELGYRTMIVSSETARSE